MCDFYREMLEQKPDCLFNQIQLDESESMTWGSFQHFVIHASYSDFTQPDMISWKLRESAALTVSSTSTKQNKLIVLSEGGFNMSVKAKI